MFTGISALNVDVLAVDNIEVGMGLTLDCLPLSANVFDARDASVAVGMSDLVFGLDVLEIDAPCFEIEVKPFVCRDGVG